MTSTGKFVYIYIYIFIHCKKKNSIIHRELIHVKSLFPENKINTFFWFKSL